LHSLVCVCVCGVDGRGKLFCVPPTQDTMPTVPYGLSVVEEDHLTTNFRCGICTLVVDDPVTPSHVKGSRCPLLLCTACCGRWIATTNGKIPRMGSRPGCKGSFFFPQPLRVSVHCISSRLLSFFSVPMPWSDRCFDYCVPTCKGMLETFGKFEHSNSHQWKHCFGPTHTHTTW
jgi:hypothetical protein